MNISICALNFVIFWMILKYFFLFTYILDNKPKYYNEIELSKEETQDIRREGLETFVKTKFELPERLEENYDYRKIKIIKMSKTKSECN